MFGRRRSLVGALRVAAVTALTACALSASPPTEVLAQPAPGEDGAEAQAARLAALKAKGAAAPIVVLPTSVAGRPMTQVGEAVALVLEQQAGFDDMSASSEPFKPAAGTKPDALAAELGEFVRAHPVGERWALYSEFAVEERRFTAVRTWIVDRDGALVWSDAQQKGDADFDKAAPREPMECCVLVAERVRGLFGLAAPTEERDGPMARYWAAKSSMPPKAELDAMAPRAEAFKKLGKAAKVAVYPVRVAGALDAAQGTALAKALAETCAATSSDAKPAIDCKPAANEQLVLWTVAKQFREHLRKNPPDADYALFADYLMPADKTMVGAVHFVLCTKRGEFVVVDFQNDHHDDFKAAAPRNVDDCRRLVTKRFARLLE
jgi:hypothetical protein